MTLFRPPKHQCANLPGPLQPHALPVHTRSLLHGLSIWPTLAVANSPCALSSASSRRHLAPAPARTPCGGGCASRPPKSSSPVPGDALLCVDASMWPRCGLRSARGTAISHCDIPAGTSQ
jgi:hypothetical protein